MQLKTIQKNISSKLDEWLKTITDESLVKDLKGNILVSGGCITSMLLSEPVNDYDVYIQDMNVLHRLTEYYVNAFGSGQIKILDGRKKENLIKELESEYSKNSWLEWQMKSGTSDDALGVIHNAYAISLRNLKPEQIKLFFLAKNGGHRIEPKLEDKDMPVYKPLFFSPNAISLSNDLQIVIRFNGNAEQIHKTFDFIHATNYFTFEDGLVTSKAALESIITKQLKYQGSLYPLTTIIRVRKFIKRNWNIGAGELLKIMFQISELELNNPDVLEEQLIGVDVAYFGKLIEVIRGIDKDPDWKMTSQYLATLIDKVFNESEDIS